MIKHLNEVLEIAKRKAKRTISVAAAHDKEVLTAVSEAVSQGFVNAILIGDKEKIIQLASENNLKINTMEIIDVKNSKDCAAKAAEIVSKGQADFLMKGMLSTGELLKAVLNKDYNLRGAGLLTHVMVYEVPSYHKLIFLTDGGMVTYPELSDKISIVNNAVSLAHSLGIEIPKVAPICAVETVNPAMQATIDASALTSMNRRGQIKGCIIDGPLALDNALSKEAAIHKGIESEVAGDADILLVPNIEAGNFLGKSMTYLAGAENAGVILGAKCPVVLVSRADSAKSKLYSIALGAVI